jgi:hypothetical protein
LSNLGGKISMGIAKTRVRTAFMVIVFIGLGVFVVVQARNYLVKRVYRGQVQDIEREIRIYKQLNDINLELWSGDNDLKQIASLKDKTKQLSPASDEIKKSKQHLLKALEYVYIAQEESGLTISQINLEEDQDKFSHPKEYLDKANDEASHSTEYLEKFEKAHQELFQ